VFKETYGDDADIQTRLFVQYGGTAPTNADAAVYAGSLATQWNTHIAPVKCNSVTLHDVEVEDLTSATGAVGAWSGTHAGSAGASGLPAGVAVVIKYPIARRYRGGHPRTYLGGLLSTALSGPGSVDPTYAAALLGVWNAFIGGVLGAGWSGAGTLNQVNVSYYQGFHNFTYPSGRTRPIPTLRGAPVVDFITSAVINLKPGSQRRRNLQSP
jgi:hypothetical protein